MLSAAAAVINWQLCGVGLRRGVLSLLGMFIPVCECGNVPFARGLLMRGFTVPETLTFLQELREGKDQGFRPLCVSTLVDD